jgi:type 1 glutamine amidotransferase
MIKRIVVCGVLSALVAISGRGRAEENPGGDRVERVHAQCGETAYEWGVMHRREGAAGNRKQSGVFETVNSQKAIEVLTRDNLKNFDAIFFYTTGMILPEGDPRDALLDFVKSGKAFIGVHSATDTFADFKPYVSFINGNFDGHPWGAGETSAFTNHEPSHVVVKMWPAEFKFKDEIYQYKGYDPNSVRVLMSLNMADTKTKGGYHVPVCWVREFGSGRLFYTNLGHNESTWKDERYREHVLTGIRWALKLEQGPAAANPAVQAVENAKSFAVVAAPMVGKEWNDLAAKAAKKVQSDPAFMKDTEREDCGFSEDVHGRREATKAGRNRSVEGKACRGGQGDRPNNRTIGL